LVHAQQIVGGRAVVVDVVPEALEDILFGEPVIFDLSEDLVVNLEVIVMLIVEVMPLLLGFGPVLAYQVLVEYIVLRDDFLFESLLILESLLLFLTEVGALALVVGILVVDAVVEVLVVELLVLAVELADACIESDCHVFVNK
jgi:hypothetical protein